jgi:hypothetical protein
MVSVESEASVRSLLAAVRESNRQRDEALELARLALGTCQQLADVVMTLAGSPDQVTPRAD